MYVVLTVLCVLPALVVVQIVRLHLYEGSELRVQAERQTHSVQPIPAMRGSILDRAGRSLVVNTARYDLALDPTVAGFEAAAATFFDKLGRLTGQPARTLQRKVARRTSPQYVLLLRRITEPQKEAIESWEVPGILLKPTFSRRYNYGRTAAHVLGHVDAYGTGLAGLELQYDEHLNGTPGQRVVQRDRRGHIKAVVGGAVVEPKHGETLVLTLDLILQSFLEEELARGVAESGARWGTAIAMNPQTGAVLGMANVPTYDPNRPGDFSSPQRRNHAITDRIEPGSTFKLVTAVAAVEQGLVSMEDSVETGQGWAVFGGRTMRDTHGYGTITFADVIAKSSNVGTAKTARRIDKGIFYQYARNLGFGLPTWIDLPGEVGGTLRRPSEWSGTTQTSMSIGYAVNVTPLQMLTAYCALANGGLLVQPYLVAERRDLTGQVVWTARQDSIRRAFKRRTAEAVLPAFTAVVDQGTAKQAQLEGLAVAGKTGTALKVLERGYSRSASRASFVGFFPAEAPEVAILVVLDEPKTSIYGGVVAAPIFQRAARRWVSAVQPQALRHLAAADTLAAPAPLPEVTGQPLAIAEDRLQAAGFAVDRARRADPLAPSHAAERDARIHLTALAVPDTLMPDLIGLSVRQATFWLASRGVDVQVHGRGRITGQTPDPSAVLPRTATLRAQ